MLLGFGFGSIPVMGTGFANLVYGQKYYGTNISLLNMNVLPTAFLGPQLTGVLYVRLGGYTPMLWGFLLYGALAALCAARVRDDVG